MLLKRRPYFLKNKNWYYYDEKKYKYMLTDEAPKEAVKSYKEYYKIIASLEQKDIKF